MWGQFCASGCLSFSSELCAFASAQCMGFQRNKAMQGNLAPHRHEAVSIQHRCPSTSLRFVLVLLIVLAVTCHRLSEKKAC